ncbi:hypothetical protein ACFL3T_01975 [Patescibacteria group bacterium]
MDSRIRKNRVINMLEKYDKKLLKYFLDNGPDKLKKKLAVEDNDLWKVVFDYLVFEKNAVKVCFKKNTNYIHSIFAEKGPSHMRKAFRLEGPKYEQTWEEVLDFIGIARGAIFEYVRNDSNRYKDLIRNGKAEQIRTELGLNKLKYNGIWEEILDLLLECVSFENFSYSMFEQGLRFFSNMYNAGRTHRSVKKTNEIR